MDKNNLNCKIVEDKPDIIIINPILFDNSFLKKMHRIIKEIPTKVIVLIAEEDMNREKLKLKYVADDYLFNPFSARELVAKISSIARIEKKDDDHEINMWSEFSEDSLINFY